MEFTDLLSLVVQITAAALVIVVAIVTIWCSVQLVRFLVLRVPGWVLGDQLANLLAAILALLILPSLTAYVVAVVSRVFSLLTDAGGAALGWGSAATSECEDCTLQTFTTLGQIVATLTRRLVDALMLDRFPISDFLWFLVILAMLSLTFRYLSARMVDGGGTGTPETRETSAAVNLTFLGIVALSFYLSLSSLLAIPMMQGGPSAEGFTVEDLQKALQDVAPTREEFDQRYPQPSAGAEPDPAAFPIALSNEDRGYVADARSRIVELIETVASKRTGTTGQIEGLQAQGMRAFSSQNALRVSGRETVEHFASILQWHERALADIEQVFAECLTSTRTALRNATAFVDGAMRVAPAINISINKEPPGTLVQRYRIVHIGLNNAEAACQATATALSPPRREDRGASLEQVGVWFNWLLGPESMPLVIIVGLIGFSLLGATMSRIVRVGVNKGFDGLDGLSLPDVLKVVAGGVAAAMVVFLASYGGLAVLGEEMTDPNPYVIFASCLIGAVFSEDVWDWARERFRVKNDADPVPPEDGEDAGEAPDAAEEPLPEETAAPVDPVPRGPTRRGGRRGAAV